MQKMILIILLFFTTSLRAESIFLPQLCGAGPFKSQMNGRLILDGNYGVIRAHIHRTKTYLDQKFRLISKKQTFLNNKDPELQLALHEFAKLGITNPTVATSFDLVAVDNDHNDTELNLGNMSVNKSFMVLIVRYEQTKNFVVFQFRQKISANPKDLYPFFLGTDSCE